MISQVDMMEVVEKYRGDSIVVATMTGNRGWRQVSKNPERDVPVSGAMGKASSVALGLALAQPSLKVIIFDGDGSLLMNLGSLVTIAEQAPKNLYHFVLENGVYAITGGQPIPGKSKVSFAGLAKQAGYASSYEFNDLEEFSPLAQKILNEPGPVFVCVKTVPEIENEPIGKRPRGRIRTSKQAIADLQKNLGVA